MTTSVLIKLENLSKYYTEGETQRLVFEELNLEIHAGEFIVLLGRSGSGKSTLLNIMSGIDAPSSGRVVIDNKDLTALNEHDRTVFRRNNIGFIFQLYNLIPTLTVQENVLLPLELTGRLKKAHHQHVAKLLGAVGLADRAKSFPDKLSGGEQQRVAVLRALIHQPLLLLADEPTGNLDTDTSRKVMKLLTTLVRKEQKTLVLVTHNQELAQSADRVFRIRDGRLIQVNMGGSA
ncbi:MAG: ABC transporter ATP-binding protein [Gammaproteobacteria bacterium]|nr:ABC transporter ATP-binding protein [Gammaproteobacteria bacterium]MDH5800975.1 ABC transporter ATP-binding protein [Gammaproteobacteria bacterium]